MATSYLLTRKWTKDLVRLGSYRKLYYPVTSIWDFTFKEVICLRISMRQPCTKYDDSIGSVTTVFEFQRTRKMKDMKNTTFAGCLFQVMATRNHWWNKSSHHWVQSNIPSTWSCDWLPTLPGMRKHIPPTIHPSWHSWRVFEDDHFPNFPVWWVPCDRFPWRVPARSTLKGVFFHPQKKSVPAKEARGVWQLWCFLRPKNDQK